MKTQQIITTIATIMLLNLTSVRNLHAQSTTKMFVQRKISIEVTDTSKIKKQIFGVNFFAPITNHIAFTYERALANQVSFSGEFGIIGVGVSDNRSSAGAYVKAGPKFYFSPDYLMDGMYRCNDMQGSYFKPAITFGFYSADDSGDSNYGQGEKTSYMPIALMLSFGKQWIVANAVALDISAGAGYGFGGSDNGYQYSHAGGNSSTPLAGEFKIAIGFLAK